MKRSLKNILFTSLLFTSSIYADLRHFAYSPPKELSLSCPRDFSLYADALALKAKQDGLEFAINDTNLAAAPLTYGDVESFSSSHSDYGYNPGARLGVLFLMGEDHWDVDFTWTWLKITDEKRASTQGVLIPLWLVPVGVPTATNQTAHATWDVNYNLLDARLGKWFHISHSFLAHPHFGARIAFIDQHYAINYGGLFGTVEGAIPHLDNDFAGLGIRGGFDTEWRLGKYWYLFGNIAAAILWGNFDIAEQLSQGTTRGYDIGETINTNIPNLDIVLGLGWGKTFYRSKFRLSSRLGIEFSEWWDMFQIRKFFGDNPGFPNDTVSRGNFTLNGFSLRVQGDF